MTSKANLFVIGAPKCGTTAIAYYLDQHSKVCVSMYKEPHFFSVDSPRLRKVTTVVDYESSFRDTADWYCDASVYYYCSDDALNAIARIPDAKVIFLIRDPIDFFVSLFNQKSLSGYETAESLEEAWHLQEQRAKGEAVPKGCPEPKHLQYGWLGKFSYHLGRIKSRIPDENIMVIVQEDMKANTDAIYRDVLSFLGLTYETVDFSLQNERRIARSKQIQWLLTRRPAFLIALSKISKRLFGIRSLGVYDFMARLNSRRAREGELDTISPGLRERLVCHYRDDVNELWRLHGISVDSKWRNFSDA